MAEFTFSYPQLLSGLPYTDMLVIYKGRHYSSRFNWALSLGEIEHQKNAFLRRREKDEVL